jgi:chorismate mutase
MIRIQENGMGMTELEQRLEQERKEIAARVARFKAMQERFQREREEYFTTTLRNAREGKPLRLWS